MDIVQITTRKISSRHKSIPNKSHKYLHNSATQSKVFTLGFKKGCWGQWDLSVRFFIFFAEAGGFLLWLLVLRIFSVWHFFMAKFDFLKYSLHSYNKHYSCSGLSRTPCENLENIHCYQPALKLIQANRGKSICEAFLFGKLSMTCNCRFVSSFISPFNKCEGVDLN